MTHRNLCYSLVERFPYCNKMWLVTIPTYRVWVLCVKLNICCLGLILVEVGMATNDPDRQPCNTWEIRDNVLNVLCVAGAKGTFVRTTLLEKGRALIVCQVEIYGHPCTYW